MDVDLHRVGVTGRRVEEPGAALDGGFREQAQEAAERVEPDRAGGELAAAGPPAEVLRGDGGPGQRHDRFARGGPAVVPGALERLLLLGGEQVHDLVGGQRVRGSRGRRDDGRDGRCGWGDRRGGRGGGRWDGGRRGDAGQGGGRCGGADWDGGGRGGGGLGARELAGDRGHGGLVEQGRDGDAGAVALVQGVGDLDHGERRRPLVPQVGLGVHGGQAQPLGEDRGDLGDQLLQRRPGGGLRGGGGGLGPVDHRPGQGGAVELAVGGGRERVHEADEVRHHVLRQRLPGVGAQLAHRRHGVTRRDDVGDELAVAGVVLAGQHHDLGDGVVLAQPVLDLAQLHPEPADLHLVVRPAQEAQVPVGEVAGPVAGEVQPLAGVERVVDEPLGGQVRAVDVALRQHGAADVEVALDADRHGFAVLVEHVVAGVVDRPAVGDAAPGRVDLADGEPVRPHRGLGGAAQADHPRVAEHRAQLVGQRQRGVVAGEEDQPQVARSGVPGLGGQQGGELVEGGGGGVPEGDRLVEQHVEQQFRVALLGGVGDVEGGADAEQAEDVEHRQVEAQRGHAQADVGRSEVELPVAPVEQVVHRPVGDRHALGLAGAAGGEDDVRAVVDVPGGDRVHLPAGGRGGVGVDDLDRRRGGPAGGVGGGQHDRAARLGQHHRGALGGQAGFDRQVHPVGLEDAQGGGDHPRASGHGDADDGLRADPAPLEGPGDAVGLGVQLAVGLRATRPAQRDRVRGGRGLPLDGQVDRAVAGEVAGGVVPLDQDLVPLGGPRVFSSGAARGPGGVVGFQGGDEAGEPGEQGGGVGEVGLDDVPAEPGAGRVELADAVQRHTRGAGQPLAGARARRGVGQVEQGGVDDREAVPAVVLALPQHDLAQLGEPADRVGLGVGGQLRVVGPRRLHDGPALGPAADPAQRGQLSGPEPPRVLREPDHGHGEVLRVRAAQRLAQGREQDRVRADAVPLGAGAETRPVGEGAGQPGAGRGGARPVGDGRARGQVGEAVAPVLLPAHEVLGQPGVLAGGPLLGVGDLRARVAAVEVDADQFAGDGVDADGVGEQQVDREVDGGARPGAGGAQVEVVPAGQRERRRHHGRAGRRVDRGVLGRVGDLGHRHPPARRGVAAHPDAAVAGHGAAQHVVLGHHLQRRGLQPGPVQVRHVQAGDHLAAVRGGVPGAGDEVGLLEFVEAADLQVRRGGQLAQVVDQRGERGVGHPGGDERVGDVPLQVQLAVLLPHLVVQGHPGGLADGVVHRRGEPAVGVGGQGVEHAGEHHRQRHLAADRPPRPQLPLHGDPADRRVLHRLPELLVGARAGVVEADPGGGVGEEHRAGGERPDQVGDRAGQPHAVVGGDHEGERGARGVPGEDFGEEGQHQGGGRDVPRARQLADRGPLAGAEGVAQRPARAFLAGAAEVGAVGHVAQQLHPVVQVGGVGGAVLLGLERGQAVADADRRGGQDVVRVGVEGGPLGQQQGQAVPVGGDRVQAQVHPAGAVGALGHLDGERGVPGGVALVRQAGAHLGGLPLLGGVVAGRLVHPQCPLGGVGADVLLPGGGDAQPQHVVVAHEPPPGAVEPGHVEVVDLELAVEVAAHGVGGQLGLPAEQVRLLHRGERERLPGVGRVGGDQDPGGPRHTGGRPLGQVRGDPVGQLGEAAALAHPVDRDVDGVLGLQHQPQPGRGHRVEPVGPQGRREVGGGARGQQLREDPGDGVPHPGEDLTGPGGAPRRAVCWRHCSLPRAKGCRLLLGRSGGLLLPRKHFPGRLPRFRR
ncbi:PE-PGRS virulence associated protein [Actinokineospora spheciospongiae]|uniref:PE-PGRS virulence associated protein n=1 Tax=Actinokineospora spheciospongiae TaxID=909613 RepID=W7IMB2_9PSEU|nr:PE-PGRS virulence associated protein [Actinokineospora spheciospongiae]